MDLPIATLSQILDDLIDYSNNRLAADYDYIQQSLSKAVTYNTD